MTMGTGYDAGDDLAMQLSAAEDRRVANAGTRMPEADLSFTLTSSSLDPADGANYAGGSSYSDDLSLNFAGIGLAGAIGQDGGQEAHDSLCSNLGAVPGLNDIFAAIGRSDRYLMNAAGKSWPSVRNEAAIDQGFLAPTTGSVKTNINKGWNAAAQAGSSPGTRLGFPRPAYKEINVGALTYAQALKYAPSSLAEKQGSLAGLGEVTGSTSAGMRKVLSTKAGTPEAGAVARELLAQSLKIADQTEKRAVVTERARDQYRSLLHRVINLDNETQRIAMQLFEPNGDPKPNVSPDQITAYRKLRQKAFELGREAIRFQKTNVIATALAKNGAVQAQLLQTMANTLLTGNPGATAVMAVQFEEIGKENAALRAQRQTQVANWKGREGLSGLHGPVYKAVTADYWEAGLAGMEAVELAYLGALEFSFKKAFRSVKKGVSSAARGVSKAASNVASNTARSISRAAVKVGTQAARAASTAAQAAAKGVRKVATPVWSTARTLSKPIAQYAKATAKVTISPFKAAYDVGRYSVRGDLKGALNSVARNVKQTASAVAAAAAAATIGIGCAAAKTPLGRSAAQIGGAAVGTTYGGPIGGAVGSEAGRRGTQVANGVCAGLDRMGLTKGTFRPNQIGAAFKQSAREIYQSTLRPKAILESAMRVGTNYATAGAGGGVTSDLISKAGTLTAQQAQDLALKELQKRGQRFATQQLQRNAMKIPALRKLNKHVPIANAIMQTSGAISGDGKINLDVIRSQLQAQGTQILQQQAQKRAMSLASRYAPAGTRSLARQAIGAAGSAIASGKRIDINALQKQAQQRAQVFLRQQAQKQAVTLASRYAPAGTRSLARQAVGAAGSAIASGKRIDTDALRRQAQQRAQAFLQQQAQKQATNVANALRARLEAKARQQFGIPGALIPTMG